MIEEAIFTWRETKDEKVLICWQGRQVTILKNKDARKFLSRISNANASEAQLIMAKATGNFKQGNERQ